MLFKFANYLLGTNNETEVIKPEEQQQLNIESNVNTQSTNLNEDCSTLSNEKIDKNLLIDQEKILTKPIADEDLIEDDYMYAEQLINCSKLKNSNCNLEISKDDHLCDQLEDDDCEDDQWIYITPIKRKNDEEKEIVKQDDQINCILVDDGDEKETSNENVPKKSDDQLNEKNSQEKFNFYDYFNNKSNLATLNEEEHCSPAKSSKVSSSISATKKLVNTKSQLNRMEESWVIHPPACFTLSNTFSLEEHPLENLYIENPLICKSIDKENTNSTSSLTNSSLKSTDKRVLADRNNLNNQSKDKISMASRKSMRKGPARKANKKENKKTKSPSKQAPIDSTAVNQTVTEQKKSPVEQASSNENQILSERQEKQLLAHYLMNPTTSTAQSTQTSNTIASSNGSTHQASTNHHNHSTHHFIPTSNNCVVATFVNASTNANAENKKGGKSFRRNNKVALKRDNLSNKPFTLHRKLC